MSRSASSWLRAHWWALLAGASAAFVVALALFLLLTGKGSLAATWLDDLGETVAALLAAAGCGLAAGRSQARHRLAWALLGASAFCWGAGQLVWDWYELLAGVQVPFPSAADAGYLSAVPLALAGVLSFPIAHDRLRSLLNGALDGLLIAGGLLIVSWETVLGTVYRQGADGVLSTVLGLAYPLGDVAVITVILARLGRTSRRGRSTLLLVAAALATLAVADSSFTYFTATGNFASGNVFDAGWVGGYLLIGLAALRVWGSPAADEPPLTAPSRLQQFLPYLSVAAALGVVIDQRVTTGNLDNFAFWTLLAVGGLVLVRQYLALGANVQLVGSLAAREKEMTYQAHHDALTGLPNRTHFQASVASALRQGSADGPSCAVFFIDLDDFKQINDTCGHATGDRVLKLVGMRLRNNLRPDDIAARLGGDEFAVLVKQPRDGRQLEAMTERILHALQEPAVVDDLALPVRGTIGVALSTGAGNGEELLRRADVAMYNAKRQGKNRAAFYPEAAAA